MRFNVSTIREWQAANTVKAFHNASRIETYGEHN